MMINCYFPKNLIKSRRWIAEIILERISYRFKLIPKNIDFWELEITNDKKKVSIKIDDSFFSCYRTNGLKKTILPIQPLKSWNLSQEKLKAKIINTNLPILYGDINKNILNSQNVRLGLDVFGSSFFMLSRIEEILEKEKDNHGRFSSDKSIANKENFLKRPIIDEYIEILKSIITLKIPNFQFKVFKFKTTISHDVDVPSRYAFSKFQLFLKRSIIDLRKSKKIKNFINSFSIRYNAKKEFFSNDPYNQFDWMMRTAEKNNLLASFNFIPMVTDVNFDGNYKLSFPSIRNLMKKIHNSGHEIGLHPSYNSFLNPEQILLESKLLKEICDKEKIYQNFWGGRMHYLRFDYPKTLYGWELAEMDYESSLGYADKVGFRCGTCFDYNAFDIIKGEKLKIKIRPLVAMECSVVADFYMNLGYGENALNEFKKIKDACRKVSGNFTLLWHNTLLETDEQRRLYDAVLMC